MMHGAYNAKKHYIDITLFTCIVYMWQQQQGLLYEEGFPLNISIHHHTKQTQIKSLVISRTLATEHRLQFHGSPSGIYTGQSGTGARFYPSTSVFPLSTIPPTLHTDLFIFRWRDIIPTYDSVVKQHYKSLWASYRVL